MHGRQVSTLRYVVGQVVETDGCSLGRVVLIENGLAVTDQFPRTLTHRQSFERGTAVFMFECSYPLLLRPGETQIYRVAWDNADGTRGRESALHRISGLQNAGFRVIDIAWDELVAAGGSVVFTEETPYE